VRQRPKEARSWAIEVSKEWSVEEYIELWLWEYTDEFGKRRRTRYRLTEAQARERYGESAKPVEGSLERRTPLGSTSDWQKRTDGGS